MTYRVPLIEIPVDNPYENDVLGRKNVVEFLAGLIGRAGGPFVLALDSPYGTGKSTLIRMLQAVLSKNDFQCVCFNAWQFDYVTDPLVAMVSALDEVTRLEGEKNAGLKAHMETLRKVTTVLAKRSVVAGVKAATLGFLDVEEGVEGVLSELAGETAQDLVKAFQRESEELSKFRRELQAVVDELPKAKKKETLVFFVDELDRCRPTFAIELLERVKHLFDVPNVAFVLSVDMRQLEASVAAVYGSGIDAPEYLRKFIDLEFGIPQIGGEAFTELLLKKFGLDDVFAARASRLAYYDRGTFVTFFTVLAEAFNMPLRVRERCVARLKVVFDQTSSEHYFDPVLVALLIVIRMKNQPLFSGIATGVTSPDAIVEYLEGTPGGKELMNEHSGHIIYASLIVSDFNGTRKTANLDRIKNLANSREITEEKRNSYSQLLNIIGNFGRLPSIVTFAKKVDIAASIRN